MKPMRAHPVLGLLLAAVWLLLRESLAPVDLLVAALWGWGLPRVLRGFLPTEPAGGPEAAARVGLGRRLRVAAWLAARVLYDVVKANFHVAALVLNPWARLQPRWVAVPLRLRHPRGVSLLASIVTMTPGTVSCVIDPQRGELLVHALDAEDAAAVIADIHRRYEDLLMELFP